jgi:hypothetical protein
MLTDENIEVIHFSDKFLFHSNSHSLVLSVADIEIFSNDSDITCNIEGRMPFVLSLSSF